jgi:hypothetical protein
MLDFFWILLSEERFFLRRLPDMRDEGNRRDETMPGEPWETIQTNARDHYLYLKAEYTLSKHHGSEGKGNFITETFLFPRPL